MNYFGCEISNGAGVWVDLNDSLNFKVAGGTTRENSAVQWRRIIATSPIYDGQYLVHAVKDQIRETMGIYIYSGSQTELAANIQTLENLFSQFSYQIRWTFDDRQEIWDCQAADYSWSRGHVWTHRNMAQFTAEVPRMPDVTYQEA